MASISFSLPGDFILMKLVLTYFWIKSKEDSVLKPKLIGTHLN